MGSLISKKIGSLLSSIPPSPPLFLPPPIFLCPSHLLQTIPHPNQKKCFGIWLLCLSVLQLQHCNRFLTIHFLSLPDPSLFPTSLPWLMTNASLLEPVDSNLKTNIVFIL
jgi:hypothetical protein